jgi:zinc transport system substrate-binding protein
MKRIVAFFVVSLLGGVLLIFFAVSKKQPLPKPQPGKIIVSSSFYPLAEFAKRVGGDKIEVVNITPVGVEAHDYEPTPRDVVAIRTSRLFLYQGANFDPWAERVAKDISGSNIAVINMAENFDLINVEAGKKDPHFWLDPILAKKEVVIISDELKGIDPDNTSVYEENTQKFLASLDILDQTIRSGLSNCALSEIIVSHEAFNYFASRYGLHAISISGVSPDVEPSAQVLGEISKTAKEKNIQYIFFETLVSPKLAETVAKEAGIQTSVLNPVEGLTPDEVSAGKDYLSIMAENLHNLEQALQCKNKK